MSIFDDMSLDDEKERRRREKAEAEALRATPAAPLANPGAPMAPFTSEGFAEEQAEQMEAAMPAIRQRVEEAVAAFRGATPDEQNEMAGMRAPDPYARANLTAQSDRVPLFDQGTDDAIQTVGRAVRPFAQIVAPSQTETLADLPDNEGRLSFSPSAFTAGAVQGATYEFGDEIAAGLGAASDVYAEPGEDAFERLAEGYRSRVDANRQRLRSMRENAPYSMGAGEIGGAFAGAAGLAGAGVVPFTINTSAGGLAAQGLLEGYLTGLGLAESVEEMQESGAKYGTLGLVTASGMGAAVPVVTRMMQGLYKSTRETLEASAELSARRAEAGPIDEMIELVSDMITEQQRMSHSVLRGDAGMISQKPDLLRRQITFDPPRRPERSVARAASMRDEALEPLRRLIGDPASVAPGTADVDMIPPFRRFKELLYQPRATQRAATEARRGRTVTTEPAILPALEAAFAARDLPEAFVQMDALKRALGHLRTEPKLRNEGILRSIEASYESLRRHLEDTRIWGQMAGDFQASTNAMISQVIEKERGFSHLVSARRTTRRADDSGFEYPREAIPGQVGSTMRDASRGGDRVKMVEALEAQNDAVATLEAYYSELAEWLEVMEARGTSAAEIEWAPGIDEFGGLSSVGPRVDRQINAPNAAAQADATHLSATDRLGTAGDPRLGRPYAPDLDTQRAVPLGEDYGMPAAQPPEMAPRGQDLALLGERRVGGPDPVNPRRTTRQLDGPINGLDPAHPRTFHGHEWEEGALGTPRERAASVEAGLERTSEQFAEETASPAAWEYPEVGGMARRGPRGAVSSEEIGLRPGAGAEPSNGLPRGPYDGAGGLQLKTPPELAARSPRDSMWRVWFTDEGGRRRSMFVGAESAAEARVRADGWHQAHGGPRPRYVDRFPGELRQRSNMPINTDHVSLSDYTPEGGPRGASEIMTASGRRLDAAEIGDDIGEAWPARPGDDPHAQGDRREFEPFDRTMGGDIDALMEDARRPEMRGGEPRPVPLGENYAPSPAQDYGAEWEADVTPAPRHRGREVEVREGTPDAISMADARDASSASFVDPETGEPMPGPRGRVAEEFADIRDAPGAFQRSAVDMRGMTPGDHDAGATTAATIHSVVVPARNGAGSAESHLLTGPDGAHVGELVQGGYSARTDSYEGEMPMFRVDLEGLPPAAQRFVAPYKYQDVYSPAGIPREIPVLAAGRDRDDAAAMIYDQIADHFQMRTGSLDTRLVVRTAEGPKIFTASGTLRPVPEGWIAQQRANPQAPGIAEIPELTIDPAPLPPLHPRGSGYRPFGDSRLSSGSPSRAGTRTVRGDYLIPEDQASYFQKKRLQRGEMTQEPGAPRAALRRPGEEMVSGLRHEDGPMRPDEATVDMLEMARATRDGLPAPRGYPGEGPVFDPTRGAPPGDYDVPGPPRGQDLAGDRPPTPHDAWLDEPMAAGATPPQPPPQDYGQPLSVRANRPELASREDIAGAAAMADPRARAPRGGGPTPSRRRGDVRSDASMAGAEMRRRMRTSRRVEQDAREGLVRDIRGGHRPEASYAPRDPRHAEVYDVPTDHLRRGRAPDPADARPGGRQRVPGGDGSITSSTQMSQRPLPAAVLSPDGSIGPRILDARELGALDLPQDFERALRHFDISGAPESAELAQMRALTDVVREQVGVRERVVAAERQLDRLKNSLHPNVLRDLEQAPGSDLLSLRDRPGTIGALRSMARWLGTSEPAGWLARHIASGNVSRAHRAALLIVRTINSIRVATSTPTQDDRDFEELDAEFEAATRTPAAPAPEFVPTNEDVEAWGSELEGM